MSARSCGHYETPGYAARYAPSLPVPCLCVHVRRQHICRLCTRAHDQEGPAHAYRLWARLWAHLTEGGIPTANAQRPQSTQGSTDSLCLARRFQNDNFLKAKPSGKKGILQTEGTQLGARRSLLDPTLLRGPHRDSSASVTRGVTTPLDLNSSFKSG